MTSNDLAIYTPHRQQEIQRLLGLTGPPNQIALLFQLAEHYQLDPLTKEIALIPGKGPFIGVWGRLHIAHRSGQLDGLELDDEYDTDIHHCVRVIVWRKDQQRPAAKVIGRVAKTEKKDWPHEIARARGLRAALGYAFSIHDTYDTQDDDTWAPPPDEHVPTTIDVPEAAARKEAPTQPAATPKKRATKAVRGSAAGTDSTAGHPGAGSTPPGSPAGPKASGAAQVGTAEAPERSAASGEPATVTSSEPAAPEQPTLLVGGHSTAQIIAIKAKAAGIEEDELRNQLIEYLTGGDANRATEVQEQHRQRVYDAFDGLTNGTLELRYYPNGAPYLVKPGRLQG